MNPPVKHLWLIPALPLVAAAVTALARRPQRRLAATLAIGSMILAFALSCAAFVSTLGAHTGMEVERHVYNFNWFQFGDTWLKLGWVLDPLTAIMLVMRSEEQTSELQSRLHLVCRLLLEKKKKNNRNLYPHYDQPRVMPQHHMSVCPAV